MILYKYKIKPRQELSLADMIRKYREISIFMAEFPFYAERENISLHVQSRYFTKDVILILQLKYGEDVYIVKKKFNSEEIGYLDHTILSKS